MGTSISLAYISANRSTGTVMSEVKVQQPAPVEQTQVPSEPLTVPAPEQKADAPAKPENMPLERASK